ncbi:MAG TPA: type VI secretion system baseplate subunit TssG, partial [Pyrinomonadaceae bacterium]|nr:type VI secretion system baseplate subunit TssG [Pyrinomonadaceae bacterium]
MPKKPLNQELFDEPYRFEFFQAVRLLEKVFPEKKAVGGNALPPEEIARFRSHVTLNFPPSEIFEITETVDELTEKQKIEMFVSFMGMVGVSGVLPVNYTELVMERIRYRDTAMWAFLDIFTHRTVSLFYRAWEKYRFPVAYERGNDDFTKFLFDFVGLGTNKLRGRMDLEDESLLPYSGLIAQKPHNVNALE